MLRKLNIFLGLLVVVLMVSWLIIPDFELSTPFLFSIGSLLFFSLGIEDVKNQKKIDGYVYILVAFIGFLVVIKELVG